jgi:hypothetical protein
MRAALATYKRFSMFYRDLFTGGGNGVLSTWEATSKAGYTKHFGAAYASGDITTDVSLNRIYGGGTGASFYLSNHIPASADYSVSATFYIVTSTGNASLWVRAEHSSGNGEDGYQVRLVTGSQWELRRIDNGSGTTLGTSTTNMPSAGGAGVSVTLSITGSSLSVTAGGSEIITATDSTYTAVGRVGVRFSGPFTSTTGVHIGPISASYIETVGSAPASSAYAIISDREIRVPGALPSFGAALSSYVDSYTENKVWRVTDAELIPASNTPITGVNGTGQGFTGPSSGDTLCISRDGGNLGAGYFRLYGQSLSGTDYIYRFNPTAETLTREPPSANNPGDGVGMYLSGITGEPEFSHEDGNVIYGKSSALLKKYNFGTDVYSTVKDVEPIGRATLTGTVTTNGTTTVTGSSTAFTTELKPGYQVTVGSTHFIVKSIASNTSLTAWTNATTASGTATAYRWPITGSLSGTGSAYGNSIAFIAVGDADSSGTYGDVHGEMISARWGGGSQDEHYVIGVWDTTDVAGTQHIWDSHRQEVGDGTTMTPLSDAICAANFDQDWGDLGANITTTGEETITVADPGGDKQWPEQGRLKIDSEECLYIKVSETSLYIHTRGYNSTTPATHSSGAQVTLRSINSHGQLFARDGRYLFITRSFNWNLTGATYTALFWDVQNDAFTRLTSPDSYSGHVTLGYNQFVNPPANSDSNDWQIHDIDDANNTTALITHISRPTDFLIGDHTSWFNNLPTGGPYDAEASTYRYGLNARVYASRPFREFDDAILLINTATSPVNSRVYRALQHRSWVSADFTLTGTWTTNGSTTISGSGGSANTELADGDCY